MLVVVVLTRDFSSIAFWHPPPFCELSPGLPLLLFFFFYFQPNLLQSHLWHFRFSLLLLTRSLFVFSSFICVTYGTPLIARFSLLLLLLLLLLYRKILQIWERVFALRLFFSLHSLIMYVVLQVLWIREGVCYSHVFFTLHSVLAQSEFY